MDSLGYLSIDIDFENGKNKSNVTVNRANQNDVLYYSYLNGTLVDSIMKEDSDIVLFDGPNPTFDVLNSKFLRNKKIESATIGLINWINGTLSTESAYYIIGKSEVAIHKKRTKRISFLFLNNSEIIPDSCYQNKESYKFRKVDSLPIKLEK